MNAEEIRDNLGNAFQYPQVENLYILDDDDKNKYDQIRYQEFQVIDRYEVYEYLEGVHARIIFYQDRPYIMSRYWHEASTVLAEMDYVRELFSYDERLKKLRRLSDYKYYVIYGIAYKLRGSETSEPKYGFVVHDILKANTKDKYDPCKYHKFLDRDDMKYDARWLGLEVVPHLGTMTLPEITELVQKGQPSKLHGFGDIDGIVASTNPFLFNAAEERVMFKLKRKYV